MINTDICVIGAGPAGLAASIEAARCGAKVLLIDENIMAGGQLFKQIHKFFGSREHHAGDPGDRHWGKYAGGGKGSGRGDPTCAR